MDRLHWTIAFLGAVLAQTSAAQSPTPLPNPTPTPGQNFGAHIDVDGPMMSVTAPGSNGAPPATAYVYELLGGAWARTAELAPPTTPGASLGYRAFLDAANARIGLPAVLSTKYDVGVLLYERVGANWQQVGVFAPANLYTCFGCSGFGGPVALRGDTVVVGNYDLDRVHVGRRQGGAWNNVQTLTPLFSTGPGDNFGANLQLSGDMLVVSAPTAFNFVDGSSSLQVRIGRVYVYTRATPGASWSFASTIDPPVPPTEPVLLSSYGGALALNSSWVAVSGFNSSFGYGVDIRARTGNSVSGTYWRLPLSTVPLRALQLDGDRLLVSTDSVRIWRFDPNASRPAWVLESTFSSPSPSSTFGYAVDLDASAVYVGDIQLGGSGVGVVWEYGPPAGLRSYCTAKLNSDGCLPAIEWTGAPSVSGVSSFTLSARNIVPQRDGVLIYGYQYASTPFLGATLCVTTPRRTSVTNSGGSAACSGVLSVDFGARIQSGVDPALTAGNKVYAQWWYRDPQATPLHGLSDAVHMIVQP